MYNKQFFFGHWNRQEVVISSVSTFVAELGSIVRWTRICRSAPSDWSLDAHKLKRQYRDADSPRRCIVLFDYPAKSAFLVIIIQKRLVMDNTARNFWISRKKGNLWPHVGRRQKNIYRLNLILLKFCKRNQWYFLRIWSGIFGLIIFLVITLFDLFGRHDKVFVMDVQNSILKSKSKKSFSFLTSKNYYL